MCLAAAEGFIGDDVFEKRDVGFHPADAELAQCAVHPLASRREVATHRGDLDQHRVIIRRHDGSGIARGGVQTDAEARGRAVVEDATVVGGEVFRGIFGRHAALDGEAVAGNLVLRWNGDLVAKQ